MYIAILTDPKLIQQMRNYEKKAEGDNSEDPDEIKVSTTNVTETSPLSVMKHALEQYDNQVEFLAPDITLYNLLQVGKFDLIINTSGKITTNYNPASYTGLLDTCAIPFCGSNVSAVYVSKDKALFKTLLRSNHIASGAFQKLAILHGHIPEINSNIKYPIVMKFFTEGNHNPKIEDKIVQNKQELLETVEIIKKKFSFSYILIEEYIPGKKFYLPIVGNDFNDNFRFLPMMEYDYPSIKSIDEKIGANLPEAKITFIERTDPLVKRARDVAKKVYNSFNCRDYAMLVFLQDERNGNLLLHEINPLTSLLPSGKMAFSADHIGESYAELVNEIVLYALIRNKMKIRGKYAKKLKELSGD